MKHLILAAGLTLIAAPAFAGTDANATAAQKTAMTTGAKQQHTYSYTNAEGTSSAIEQRNNRLQRNAMERSDNAKRAWSGLPHFY